MLKTINQIKKEFQTLATAHDQINDFYFGNFLEAYESSAIKHCFLLVDVLSATPVNVRGAGSYVDLQLLITVADIVYEGDNEHMAEVKSDTLQIIEDIANTFESPRWSQFCKVVGTPVATYFRQRGGDLVDGWAMPVTLRVVSVRDLCAIPYNDYDLGGVFTGGSGGTLVSQFLTCGTLADCPTIIAINDLLESTSQLAAANAANILQLDQNIQAVDADLQDHVGDTANPHQVTAVQVGAPTVLEAQGYAATAEANAKAYADLLVAGVLNLRSAYDASGNVFPSAGGSGAGGAIKKGDLWFISVGGTLGGQVVTTGDFIFANQDTPGQTAGNWSVGQVNITYVPENEANKDTDGTLAGNSDVKYPSQKAVKTYADTKLAKSGGTLTGAIIEAEVAIAALNLNWALGGSFYKTITADNTFTFSNLADGQTISVELTADGTGGWLITWPAGIIFLGGLADTQTLAANKTTIYTFTRKRGVVYCVYQTQS